MTSTPVTGHEAHGLRSTRRQPARVPALLLGCLLVGALSGSFDAWWPTLRNLVYYLGQAQLAANGAGRTTGAGRSEYLVVLRRKSDVGRARHFFRSRPDIDYLGTSVYPATLRVSLQVPVADRTKALQAQPFVWTVMPALPIFFCH